MTGKAGRPYADTQLVKFLEKRVLELRSRKTQLKIAEEAGFLGAPNSLAMIKRGSMKLPLDRVPALAAALDCDPKYLFALALEQNFGSAADRVIEEIFGTVVTANEIVWLREIREASGFTNPSLTTRARSAIRGIFGR